MMESESPPSSSTHSEPPLLSEDSGLVITSGSFSSDSASGWHQGTSELQESDCDEKSLSRCEFMEFAERVGGSNFNTVKKGPNKVMFTTIEPPPEFQDSPTNKNKENKKLIEHIDTMIDFKFMKPCCNIMSARGRAPSTCSRKPKPDAGAKIANKTSGVTSSHARPSSRSSLSSRLSSSHNSLITPGPADEFKFISQAVSHDTLATKSSDILDMYNVPFDSDIYSLPIDNLKHGYNLRSRVKFQKPNKKRKSSQGSSKDAQTVKEYTKSAQKSYKEHKNKPTTNAVQHDVRKCGNTSSSDSDSNTTTVYCKKEKPLKRLVKGRGSKDHDLDNARRIESNNNHEKSNKNTPNQKSKGISEEAAVTTKSVKSRRHSPLKLITGNLRETFSNMFRWRRQPNEELPEMAPAYLRRELPPVPAAARTITAQKDFALSLNKVKDYGWYWGPIAVETAEKILANEPDGSFLVRDSSDDHYIFTLTFKLDGIRHVRIEYDQGCFCFGGCTLFKAHTIVEFVETAVETSRSGRYLFFLNLRPEVGPVRVQLLYPVSRFKRVQGLQHLCRFLILKHVRRDLISSLPLPLCMLDYLSSPHYYSEMLADDA